MARANPRLPKSIRMRAAKIPDYKVAQYVKGSPRFKLGERRAALQGAMSTRYLRSDVKEAIRKARESGVAVTHEDEDVRHFLRNYGSENELSPEGLKRWFTGAEKFLAGHRAFRFKYAVRPGHAEEDAPVKAKLLAREAVAEKKGEMLEEAREKLARKQRRADLRDPERRAELFRPGAAAPMGSSVVQKESPSHGMTSVFEYKPGSAPGETPNPANAGSPNPTGPTNPAGAPPTNPAGGAAPLPLAGFRGLTHTPGHELPGDVGGPSHAPGAPSGGPGPAADAPTASISSVPSIGSPDEPSAPTPAAPAGEPEDMEIG